MKVENQDRGIGRFRTTNVFTFHDGPVSTSVAYQTDGDGGYRLALVDDSGRVLAHGYRSPYDHHVFAEFGTQKFIAFTSFFDDEIGESQIVYRLGEGCESGGRKPLVEEGGDDEGQDDDEIENALADKPWVGWYISSSSVDTYGNDLVQLNVCTAHTDGRTDELETHLDPGAGDLNSVRREEHAGEGYGQQSIVVTVEDSDECDWDIQVEIDRENGTFKEASLHGWEKDE